MEEKLSILLNQIKFPKELYKYFENGVLTRIVGNRDHDVYRFMINVKEVLPCNVYDVFNNLLHTGFPKFRKVYAVFSCENKDSSKLKEYYSYFMDLYSKNNVALSYMKNNSVSYEDGIFTIEVGNIAEKMNFSRIEEKLLEDLKNVGFGELGVRIVINDSKNQDVKKAIENSLKEVPKINIIKEETKEEPKKNKFKKRTRTRNDDPSIIYGRLIDNDITHISDILGPMNNVALEVNVFGIDVRETRTDLRIVTLKITDYTDSIYGKMFINSEEELKLITSSVKEGCFIKVRGIVKDDTYSNELVLNIYDINKLDREVEKRIDDALEKRVELHAHTMMSQMDGAVDAAKLVNQAHAWGHKAIAITDHNGCQAFPVVYRLIKSINKGIEKEEDKFKAIYGTELTMIDDEVKIVVRPTDTKLLDNEYVVFDFETTGFNAGGKDSIIEIGAVKLKDGVITERYDELINPGRKLPSKIIELTNITDEMLADKDNEENAVKRFKDWIGDLPLVAHNARFDTSFLEMAYKKYNLGELTNPIIDTLELSRTMDNNFARHSLSALVKRYSVPWDEDAHHRGDYDAEGTALVFHKMMKKLDNRNLEKMTDLDSLVSKDEIHKYGEAYHINILVKDKVGLKNLFKLVSAANTKYLYKTPRILRSEIEKHREGLLIGSGCYESEVFRKARSKTEEELANIVNFYDYVEVQPVDAYDHLLQMGDFGNKAELIANIKKVIQVTDEAGKFIVATGDVHYLNPDDKIYREIIVNQKVPGGGRHPLARKNITSIPNNHFRTTKEMLDAFDFLDDEMAHKIVIENPNKIADMIGILEVIIETGGVPFSPRVKGDDGNYLDCPRVVTDLVYNKARDWYGDILPSNIEKRIATELYGDVVLNTIKSNLSNKNLNEEELENESLKLLHKIILEGFDSVKELIKTNIMETSEDKLTEEELEKEVKKKLGGIIGGGFDPIYLIAQRLVKKSNDDGFLVGSRGSVGSSFVATMMSITEVNPLPAHYRCPKCKHSIFHDEEGKELGSTYSSGFDLPDFKCPKCGSDMIKDGQDMPFATFLGFNADKVPDIDLNFSDLNQAATHEYTKVLFGVDNVYRAGTIGTVAEKTAFGYVKGYCEDKGIMKRTAEIERLARGCTGIKRTTGQHPGGIVVIPDYMDVFDFTPFQYPADDVTSAWRTTHFDYHSIEDDVLKLDILGHSDPTQLRMIQDVSGDDVTKVPLDDKETMDIFLSPKPLGVTAEEIMCDTGTLGIPEFGTPFTIQLVKDTKPTTFAELIKISGLSHGTDVWLGNAQELIKNNVVPFKEVIGCRDDIMVYLMYHGVEPIKAFKIMEFVRKGRASKDPDTWLQHKKTMEDAGIEKWFIDSCGKIKYMFPKAHAAAYVISAFRIAYYKVHHPVWYYVSWFSTKATDFDIETMIKGYDAIKAKIKEISDKGYDASNKEAGILETLKLALEATARGIKFANVDLYESEATTFKVKDDKTIYPPFSSIDGLGDTVANKIVKEREKRHFLSIEDLQKRGKVSATLIDRMRMMGILDGMDESSQLSLF